MEDIRSVQKYLRELFEEIRTELEENRFVRNLVGSEENLRTLIDRQRELISEYIENWESGAKDFSQRFEELYTSVDVPYTVVAWNIEKIKSKIMEKLIEEGYSQEFVIRMKKYLEDLINQIAKIYLRKDVKTLKNFKDSLFADRLLYKVHKEWFLKIAECVEKDDFTDFPLMSASECEFSEVIEYPESLFVCLDANMCTYIHNLHTLIHDTANTFYAFYTKGMFYQAYRVFKDMTELVAKLLKVISELYFLAYSDPESNFFKLAHGLSSLEGYKYVSLIDVQDLRKINRTHGERVGDEILKRVSKGLREITSGDMGRTLVVRGVTSNFYMINIGYSESEIKALVNEIANELNFTYRDNGRSVSVSVSVATLELEPFVEIAEDELRDILFYLKEEAKKSAERSSISIGKEKRAEIVSWINEKYRNVEKIKRKIEQGEIELVFHPIVDTRETHRVAGAEVLARLKEGEKLIPAGVFIDLIYELELVEKLDIQILRKLSESKEELKPVGRLFVNVSSRSLMSENYLRVLCDFIKEMKGVEIVMELTEQQLLENTEAVVKVAQNGHVAIAVDDFGTGYSSLKLVADLVDKGLLKILKIDGSLIRKVLDSHAIWKVVDIISVLSKRLDTKTVAGFVETEKELSVVRSMGIDYCQGYYIARHMTLPELLAWIKSLH
jgi:EAL domain-containing protein (putative c-di-GMP-specific phosphodiesterase class I)/GGDEF domain-containing protein